MQKTIFPEIASKDLIYSLPGYLYFLYLLFPFRFWEKFVFSNQIETIIVSVFFACSMLLFSLSKAYGTKIFSLTKTDLILAVYGIYMLIRFRYPLEKEYLFTAFSIVCIYLYFRNFPGKYFIWLLFLLPIAAIVQIICGIMQFTMPWQNISHITGIFFNTGLFGGFAALGLCVCVGMILFPCSCKRHFKYIIFAISVVFGIILAVQVYASGSRASWLAASGAILFLLVFQNANNAKSANLRKHYISQKQRCKNFICDNLRFLRYLRSSCLTRYFIIVCSVVLLAFSSKHLYDLKKDSADCRLIIGRISLEMVKQAPLFGSGISGFRAEYLNYQADYFRENSDSPYSIYADDIDTPFNEFLKILIEQGFIGLLLFGCALYCLFGKRTSKPVIPRLTLNPFGKDTTYQGIAGQARNDTQSIILFILLFGLFSYPFDKLPFVALFVCFIAGLSQTEKPVFTVKWGFRMTLIALCLISGIIVWEAYSYSTSCRMWNKALVQFSYDKEESLSQLEKLYPVLENNPVFLTTYGKALGFGEHYAEATPVLEKAVERLPNSISYIELGKSYEAAGFSNKALECWEHAGFMVPVRFTPLYLTMKLYFKNGEYEKAKEYAGRLLAKKIKIDSPEIDGMKREAMEIQKFHPPPE